MSSTLTDADHQLLRAAAAHLERVWPDHPNRAARIHDLTLPTLMFCVRQARASPTRPVIIGLQGPQGAGKTSLVTQLVELLPMAGLKAVAMSIDDFYWPRAEQLRLAAAHPGNPALEHRGYPGTHDVALGESVLQQLRSGQRTMLPVYDKSAHGGRGDRLSESHWREVSPPIDVVLFEGWMLGFTPAPEASLPAPFLIEPNRLLADYERWHRHLAAFIVLRALDPRFVLRWRVEAEEDMKARGLPGLSREAIEDYIRRFLPAYEVYAGRPVPTSANRTLTLTLDEERRVVDSPQGFGLS